jgi:KaiC/GvpD/RAD55 family RecA-like ATPase
VFSHELWLMNVRARREVAGQMERLIPAPAHIASSDWYNWETVVDEVCHLVVAHENRPLEIVQIEPSMASQTSYLLPGIIPINKPTILYGAGGTGKSIFAASLAVALETGQPFIGLKPTRKVRVLYLDWETEVGDIAHRMNVAARGMGFTHTPRIRYMSLVRPIEDEIGQLATTVAENDIELVIIDSVGMAMSSSRDGADASEGAIRFFRALRQLGCSVLAIDHISGDDVRRGKAGAAKPYGSVYKWNSARNAFELRESRDADAYGTHLTLKHRKSNLGPRLADLNITLDWSDGEVRWTRDDEVIEKDPLDEAILDALVLGPATPRQITDLLLEGGHETTETEVRIVLKSVLSAGKVTVLADGSIRLAKPAPDAVESE